MNLRFKNPMQSPFLAGSVSVRGKLMCFLIGLLVSGNVFSQTYQKDIRSKDQKEDPLGEYQDDAVSKYDLLKALESVGIRIFKCPLPVFDKEYKMTINIDEYVEGKKINSKNILQDLNTYTYFQEKEPGKYTPHKDYLDQLTFFTKDTDSSSNLNLKTYSLQTQAKLKKRSVRANQFYLYRRYSKTSRVLNKDIPLLVYASSWYDKKFNVERFCGVVDLSYDEKATQELFNNSPHYYVISYNVSN